MKKTCIILTLLLFGGILAAQTNGNDLKRHTRFLKSITPEDLKYIPR